MKRFIAMLFCMVLVATSSSLACVFAQNGSAEAYSNYDIIVELAKAYDRQGAQIPYDQLNARRSIYSSPEDATAQRTIFLDCSSYVNSCYREAFGVNVLPYEIGATGTSPSTVNFNTYAKENPDAVDVVGYWEPLTDCATDEARAEVVDFISKNLQIGDILTYRHGVSNGTKGHTYIYVGNAVENKEFMHCAGAGSYVVNSKNPALSYDSLASEIESEGTIETAALYNIFKNTSHSRYIFKKTESDTVYSFGIIRPLARGLTPTEEALNRMKIAGLSMEKTSSVCENASVNTNDILTYTVTLENTNSTALSGVTISDTIPGGTEFVSGDSGVAANGSSVSWTGDVAGGATITVSYSVKVTATIPGTLIVSNNTYVSGVKLGCITHSLSGYSASQKAKLGEVLAGYADNGLKFDNTIELAKTLYKSTYNADIFAYSCAGDMLDDLIDTPNRTRFNSTELSKMIAPNMYGGLDIRYGWLYLESENDKTRLPKEEHLSVGDIIVADWNNDDTAGETAYVYAGNKTLITADDGTAKALTIGDDIYTKGDNIIISLLGYDRYAVLRPSLVLDAPETTVESIKITTPPSKLSYKSGEIFNPDGMVVEAVLADGTTEVISGYTVNPSEMTYPMSYVTIRFGAHSVTLDVAVTQAPKSVTQAKASSLDTEVFVTGLVAGVAKEAKSGSEELILKDLSNDTLIPVRNIPYGTFPDYGYKKGDIIEFYATIKGIVGTSDLSYNSNVTKKYLEFSADNGTIDLTIVSRGNDIVYNLDNVITLDSWATAQAKVNKGLAPYTYLKIKADSYMRSYNGNNIVHKNPDATAQADAYTASSRYMNFLDDMMQANLGDNWKSLFGIASTSSSYPGKKITKEFYALYIGGKGPYQLVVLDEDWIYDTDFYVSGLSEDKKTAKVNIPKAGTYTVVFADYESGVLSSVATTSITAANNQLGINTVNISDSITLNVGDKIMILNSIDDITPRCAAYIIK